MEGLLLDAFGEELLGGIGGVRATEELLGDVFLRRHCRSRMNGLVVSCNRRFKECFEEDLESRTAVSQCS